MSLNLDSLKEEIQRYLEQEGFVVFHGFAHALDPMRDINWNTAAHDDFRQFLNVARALDVRVIVFHSAQFQADAVDEAMEQLESTDLPRDEIRRFERRLREMRAYEGFTHEIELCFDHGGRTYAFELQTEWYESFQDLLEELDLSIPGGDDEDDTPMGGYFSNN